MAHGKRIQYRSISKKKNEGNGSVESGDGNLWLEATAFLVVATQERCVEMRNEWNDIAAKSLWRLIWCKQKKASRTNRQVHGTLENGLSLSLFLTLPGRILAAVSSSSNRYSYYSRSRIEIVAQGKSVE
jgi:hypothetical protein